VQKVSQYHFNVMSLLAAQPLSLTKWPYGHHSRYEISNRGNQKDWAGIMPLAIGAVGSVLPFHPIAVLGRGNGSVVATASSHDCRFLLVRRIACNH